MGEWEFGVSDAIRGTIWCSLAFGNSSVHIATSRASVLTFYLTHYF